MFLVGVGAASAAIIVIAHTIDKKSHWIPACAGMTLFTQEL